MWLDYYHIDLSLGCSALLACISIWVIFGAIILLSETSNGIPYANISKEDIASKDKESNRGAILNLVTTSYVWRGVPTSSQFIYDSFDPSGVKLLLLFPSLTHRPHTQGGYTGVIMQSGSRNWDPSLSLAKPIVPTAVLADLIWQGNVFESNGQPAIHIMGPSFAPFMTELHIRRKI